MATFVADFETEEIRPRPDYPPKPVGCALMEYGARKSTYLAWGHPTGNNTTKADARRHLLSIWKQHTVIFHGAKFDMDVGREHLGLPVLPADRFRCTLIEAFLYDPNRLVLSLKPMSEELLDMPPDEQTKLHDWIAANVPEAKRALADAERRGKKAPELGRWIAKAPGKLVARYAKGDVIRTGKLHRLFLNHLDAQELEWYETERRLCEHLIEEEAQGVPVNAEALKREIKRGEALLERVDDWVRDRIELPDGFELSQSQKVADALESAGIVEEWIMTEPSKKHPSGQRSMKADNLKKVCLDDVFLDAWQMRSLLANQLQTFARPWFEVASATGCIWPSWNQVRQASERQRGKSVGARTGRMSSSPNVQNIPKKPRPVVRTHKVWKKWEKTETPALMVPIACRSLAEIQLLDMRSFIEAPRGQRLFDRDYSQQELHLLAHFEQGALQRAYLDDPGLDVHNFARDEILRLTGRGFARTPVKTTGFGIIYGMGIPALAEKIQSDNATAKTLKSSYLAALPGIQTVIDEMKEAARNDEYVRTWGGRRFKCEDPIMVDGRERTLDYKMINTLIQGSAADQTKRATVEYYEHPNRDGRLMLFTHDQLTGMARTRAAKRQNRILRECMEGLEGFRVGMPSTGGVFVKWSEAKD